MSTKNSAETAEVRLVRYAKLGSLPTVAMLTVSASSAAMSDHRWMRTCHRSHSACYSGEPIACTEHSADTLPFPGARVD